MRRRLLSWLLATMRLVSCGEVGEFDVAVPRGPLGVEIGLDLEVLKFVTADGAVQRGGVRVGDRIVAVGGRRLAAGSSAQLLDAQSQLSRSAQGKRSVTFQRRGPTPAEEAATGAAPAAEEDAALRPQPDAPSSAEAQPIDPTRGFFELFRSGSVADDGGLVRVDARLADFGAPPKACGGRGVHFSRGLACGAHDLLRDGVEGKYVVVDRGGCDFAQKALAVGLARGAALVVADTAEETLAARMTADAEFLRLNPVAANVTAVSVSKDGGARLRRAFEAALKAHKFKVEARLIFEPNCRLEAGRWIPAAAAAGAVAADARHGSVDAATARAAQAVRRARHPQSTDAAPHGEARGGAVVLVGRAAVPVVDVNLGACVPVFDAPMVKPWEVDAVGDLKSYLAGYLAGDRGAVVALEATADAANLGGWPLLEALDALNATSTRLVLVLTGDALRRTALTPAYTHALFAQHLPRDDGTPGLGFAVAIVAPLASATLRAALPAAIRAIRAQPRASRTWRELDKLADAQNWPSQSAQRRRVYGALRNLVGPEGFEADADQFELLRRIWDEVGGPRHEEL